jgi:hypothetical protein
MTGASLGRAAKSRGPTPAAHNGTEPLTRLRMTTRIVIRRKRSFIILFILAEILRG